MMLAGSIILECFSAKLPEKAVMQLPEEFLGSEFPSDYRKIGNTKLLSGWPSTVVLPENSVIDCQTKFQGN